jgi:UDP-N-acetylmuramyl pentapeptide phosphotransferase/UDP-N-acetylglucosamine-1-phosphate transferase
MPSLCTASILAIISALLSWSLVGLYARAMARTRQLDNPNERSMHRVPVPVGAGLAIVATTLVLWPLSQGTAAGAHVVLLACFAALGSLSWLDDRRPLSPAMRLGAQALAVGLCLALMPPEARVSMAVPLPLERLALGLGWLWFINLFNFMDGIDGLAGSEAVAVALGYLLLLTHLGIDGPLWHLALIIAAASAGYLLWNWHPAKVFMGDAGSIPLGFLLGWLMIDLAVRGYWSAAVILPLYFALDATITLLRRGLNGKKPWQAHREHFYQRAVLGGTTPAGVVWRVVAANLALLILALLSVHTPLLALGAAAASVAILLVHLQGLARRRELEKRDLA